MFHTHTLLVRWDWTMKKTLGIWASTSWWFWMLLFHGTFMGMGIFMGIYWWGYTGIQPTMPYKWWAFLHPFACQLFFGWTEVYQSFDPDPCVVSILIFEGTNYFLRVTPTNWYSIWDIVHYIWHILAFYLALCLAFYLTFYLAFYLTYILTFYIKENTESLFFRHRFSRCWHNDLALKMFFIRQTLRFATAGSIRFFLGKKMWFPWNIT